MQERDHAVRISILQHSTVRGRNPKRVLRLFTIYGSVVHGVGKWFAKLRNGKFSPGIEFTICTNQFHLPENGREGPKLISKMALKKWNSNFRLEYSIRKNRTTFSDVPLLLEIFCWEDPKKSCQCFIYFPTGIPGKFL